MNLIPGRICVSAPAIGAKFFALRYSRMLADEHGTGSAVGDVREAKLAVDEHGSQYRHHTITRIGGASHRGRNSPPIGPHDGQILENSSRIIRGTSRCGRAVVVRSGLV